jgi:hypothetical protein
LAIKVHSSDITSFNPEESVNHWINSSTRTRRPNLKDKINDNTCNFKVHIIEDDHVPVQQPSLSEIVQSTTPAANIPDICSINSDREYAIHNLLGMMEDLRQDILNDKLYDSDTDHDMTLMKMKILIFPNCMHFLQENEVKLSLKCLQLFNK